MVDCRSWNGKKEGIATIVWSSGCTRGHQGFDEGAISFGITDDTVDIHRSAEAEPFGDWHRDDSGAKIDESLEQQSAHGLGLLCFRAKRAVEQRSLLRACDIESVVTYGLQ